MKLVKNQITLVSVFLLLFSSNAKSEEVPFYITNDDQFSKVYACCLGPFYRSVNYLDPNQLPIEPQTTNYLLYTAIESVFTLYGEWYCSINLDNPECLAYRPDIIWPEVKFSKSCELNRRSCHKFCLTPSPNSNPREVHLYITTQGELDTLEDYPENCPFWSSSASLGDNGKNNFNSLRPLGLLNQGDTDTFSFYGKEGDQVKIVIEPDPQSGHLGHQATLILQDTSKPSSLKRVETDSIPFELSEVLPADGEYNIIVQQSGIPQETRFRGDYHIRIESSLGGITDFIPSNDVEK